MRRERLFTGLRFPSSVATLIIEMIRICPKCGDYYADASLAFCLVDGTPLINVDPFGERWSEGTRVIEEKENALRKQKRKLKWRRILLGAMTMAIATMVVLVVAVNGLIYLRPKQEEVVPAKPSTEATASIDSTTPNTPVEPVSTPSPQPAIPPKSEASPIATEITTPTPTPTATPIPTPAPTPTHTPTPTPTPTPPPTPTPTPTPTTTPTPWPIPTPTPRPTPTPEKLPECTDADKSRIGRDIIGRFSASWRRRIEGERQKIIAENVPEDFRKTTEASLGEFEYDSMFSCTAGVVVIRYVWQVRTSVNGVPKDVRVTKKKRITCVGIGGTWLCR